MSLIRLGAAAMYVGAALMASGCAKRDRAARHRPAAEVEAVRADTAPPLAATRQPGALRTVQTAPVELWTGPGGRPFDVAVRTSERDAGHPRRFGGVTLQTAIRQRALGQYPCTSCHLGRKVVMAEERVADAHQNIQPVHPKQTGALCSTCHAEDDVERLVLLSGQRATMDETYRLCAQCHSAQADAWAHGAHGKRLDGWQGRRVVMGCADCHDPHRPGLAPRIPFRAPRIERTRGPADER